MKYSTHGDGWTSSPNATLWYYPCSFVRKLFVWTTSLWSILWLNYSTIVSFLGLGNPQVEPKSMELSQVDPLCVGSINFHQLCAGFAVLAKARKLINYRELLGRRSVGLELNGDFAKSYWWAFWSAMWSKFWSYKPLLKLWLRYLQQDEVVEYRRIFKHTTERKGQSSLVKTSRGCSDCSASNFHNFSIPDIKNQVGKPVVFWSGWASGGLTKSDLDKILRRMGAKLSKLQLKEWWPGFGGSGLESWGNMFNKRWCSQSFVLHFVGELRGQTTSRAKLAAGFAPRNWDCWRNNGVP